MKAATETEVKIRVSNRAAILESIRRAGLAVSALRQFEANTLYDTAEQTLRLDGMLLRLRQVGENCILTWKGRGVAGPHKSRPELETGIASCDTLGRILVQLGFEPVFRYEKYRTEFAANNAPGVVTLDETPIGDFLELEGPAEWIDRTAIALGFGPEDYILESYGTLYFEDCKRRGLEPADMVFTSHP